MTQLRFALAQIDTCVGALDANAAKVLDLSLIHISEPTRPY